MRRWIAIVLVCAGCGSSNPAGSPDVDIPQTPPQTSQAPMVFVRVADYEAYLEQVRSSFVPILVMTSEFESITSGWFSGFVPAYWTQQYLTTLLSRLDAIEEGVRKIRPEHPELLQLHIDEYEAALKDFREGFGFLVQHVAFSDADLVNQMNDKIVEGNVHLIRFQILLGDLGGRRITLGTDGN